MKQYRIITSILVEAEDMEDARATINSFLQRDDGELDDGTAIVAWWFRGQNGFHTEDVPEDAGEVGI